MSRDSGCLRWPPLGWLSVRAQQQSGLRYSAERLAREGVLRPGPRVDEATDILWVLSSFDTFDQLYTGRGLSVDDVAARLITMAEHTLMADP